MHPLLLTCILLTPLGSAAARSQPSATAAGRAAPTPPLAELVVPASARGPLVAPWAVDPQGEVLLVEQQEVVGAGLVTTYIPIHARTEALQVSGDLALVLPGGVQLNLHQAQVKVIRSDASGEHRVLITPLPDDKRK